MQQTFLLDVFAYSTANKLLQRLSKSLAAHTVGISSWKTLQVHGSCSLLCMLP